MSNQRHIIGRTVLELNTGTIADVWELQEDASQVFYQRLAPEMEQLFDRLIKPDEVVRLDQLVVEVGAIAPHTLSNELPRQVVAALERALSDRISTLKLQGQLTGTVTVGEDGEDSIQNRATADWTMLLYFLEYGRLPWWCPVGDWQGWFPRWEAVMQRDTVWRPPMQRLLATNPTARHRFVLQLPVGFRQQCLLQLQPGWMEWPSRLAQARQLMQVLGLSQIVQEDLEHQAWLLLLAELQPNQSIGKSLPAAPWARRWLAQLVEVWRSQFSPSLVS